MLWERLMLVGVALAYAIIAATLQPPYVFGALVARVPWLWPAVFATASVTSLAWALFPRLRLLAWASLHLVWLIVLRPGLDAFTPASIRLRLMAAIQRS